MSIKIKLRPNHKATVKFDHPVDERFFMEHMRDLRDDGLGGKVHPKIILKNRDGFSVPKAIPHEPVITPKAMPVKTEVQK